MRALVCESLTGIDALKLRHDQPEPKLRADQVLVAARAAGLNFPDLLMLTGTYQHKAMPPFVPGMEVAGRIAAVGDDVATSQIGRAVMAGARHAFADLVAVDLADVVPVPEGWSMAEAAGFPVVAKTAFHALVHRAALHSGEWLVVHGASGGTGHMAVLVGKALGAKIIATTGKPAKHDSLRLLGADHVLDATAPDLAEQMKAATGGRGVDVVFDPVGGAVFEASLKACRFGGRVLVVGFTAGAPNDVRSNYALIKGLSILGVRAGEAARHDPRIGQSYRLDLPDLAKRADLKPRLGANVPLAEGARAFRLMRDRSVSGKIVLMIGQD